MKINWKTTSKILGALLVWEVIVEVNNRLAINRLIRHKKALLEVNSILAQTLDNHGIELDTFDEIVINDIFASQK